MKIFKLLFIASAIALPVAAQADTLSFAIGGGIWDHDPSGYLRYIGDEIDVKDDLHLDKEQEGYIFATLEHPVPLLPNVRIQKTTVSTHGDGLVSTSFDYGGTTYTVGENIVTDLAMDQTDFIFYWELLDNVVSLDLGLNIKHLDGTATLEGSTSGTETSSFDGYIPMLYGMVGASPVEGLYLGIDGSLIGASGSSISDITARVSYTTSFKLGVEAGYRKMAVDLDDLDGHYGKVDFKGPFAGAYLKF